MVRSRSILSPIVTRRQILRAGAAAGALTLTSQLWRLQSRAQEPITIGFIYVGPKDDFGYNQAHFEGKETIAGLEGVTTVDEANVAETTAVEESMRSMIELDGARVLFPTSFGYFDPYILELAEEYPEVQFFHAGGLYQEGVHPENVGSYFGYIDEAQYVAGIVAGHSINPDITTQIIFTGDWALPVKEAEAANSMADQGIDIITCHVDSPKIVMETAERRGIYCSGYHANQQPLAPEGYLTGAEWDWSSIYTNYVTQLSEGKTLMNGGIPHLVRGGLREKFCKLSPYGPAVSDEAKADADQILEQFMEGSFQIYTGELQDNEGNVVIPEGEAYEQTAVELERTDWLVEGVIGSTQG